MKKLICLVATIDIAYQAENGEIVKKSITKVDQQFECPENIAKDLVKAKVAVDITNGIPSTVNQASLLQRELNAVSSELAEAKDVIGKTTERIDSLESENEDLKRKVSESRNDTELLSLTRTQLTNKTSEVESLSKRVLELEKLLADATAKPVKKASS